MKCNLLATTAATAMVAGSLWLTGCEDDVLFVGCPAPHAPVNVFSETGDDRVTLFWTVQDPGLTHGFVVYRSRELDRGYRAIGETGDEYFVDRGARNGVTYYYAVSAVGDCGVESELSREVAYDTPRPEGYDERLYDANGSEWRRSGWDFSAYRAVPWDAAGADMWFIVDQGIPFLVAADVNTDIQDAGYGLFEDLGWSPEDGWSPSGAVEVIPGHCYLVWTRDNHFAKLRVLGVGGGRVAFDWAYQTDRGNQELKPGQRRASEASSLSPSTGPAGSGIS